jgi:hypothetical protein
MSGALLFFNHVQGAEQVHDASIQGVLGGYLRLRHFDCAANHASMACSTK